MREEAQDVEKIQEWVRLITIDSLGVSNSRAELSSGEFTSKEKIVVFVAIRKS